MPVINGSLIILQVDDPDNPGTHLPLTCQKDSNIDESVSEIDSTCKKGAEGDESDGWMTVIGGEGSWSASVEVLYQPGEKVQKEIKRRFRAKILTPLFIYEDGVAVEQGIVLITGHNLGAPKQDVASINLSLKGSGPLVAVPAA